MVATARTVYNQTHIQKRDELIFLASFFLFCALFEAGIRWPCSYLASPLILHLKWWVCPAGRCDMLGVLCGCVCVCVFAFAFALYNFRTSDDDGGVGECARSGATPTKEKESEGHAENKSGGNAVGSSGGGRRGMHPPLRGFLQR